MLSEVARIGVDSATLSPAQTNHQAPVAAPANAIVAAQEGSERPALGPNPAISYDPETRTVLFQVLDQETGEVRRQFPAEHQVEAYRRQIRLGTPEGADQQEAAPSKPTPPTAGLTAGPTPGAAAGLTAGPSSAPSAAPSAGAGDRSLGIQPLVI